MGVIKINGAVVEGETIFRRKKLSQRKKVHEGGSLHIERIYASGGMVVTVFHNYVTNEEEPKYDSIGHALEKVVSMREMQKNSPEWVDDRLVPAVLKAISAAQRQENENRGIIINVDDPGIEDIAEECGELESEIARAREADPELDREMTEMEMDMSKEKRK